MSRVFCCFLLFLTSKSCYDHDFLCYKRCSIIIVECYKSVKKCSKMLFFEVGSKRGQNRQKTLFLGVFGPDSKNRRGGYVRPPFLAFFGLFLIEPISEN